MTAARVVVPTSPSRGEFTLIAVAIQGAIVGVALLLDWFFRTGCWDRVDWSFAAIASGIALSLPLTAMAIVIADLDWGPFGTLHRDFDRLIELFRSCTIWDLLLISLLAGIGEEVLFRGVIQNGLASLMPASITVVIASLIFGLAHPISTAYVVGVTIIGVYLGALYIWFDNIVVPIVVHAAYDFLALIYAVRIRKKP